MLQKTFLIRDPLGLHARPAGLLVKEAQRFSCDITLSVVGTEKTASLKKLFAILALEAREGDTLLLCADGQDEQQAMTDISAVLCERLC